MTRTAALLLIFVLALPALAQQQLAPSGETIDVSLVNVDVFVTDQKGRRVTGLTADDFEIRENGRAQPITNFAEYLGSTANQKRTVLLFVERFSLPSFHTKPLFATMRKTLRNVIRAGDSAAVVFWDNHSSYMLQYFTDDLTRLEAALTEVERQSFGVAGSTDEMQTNAQFAVFRRDQKAAELKALMRSMAVADGRKIVILATNDGGLYYGSPNLYTDRFRDALVRTANEHGITLYPIYPAGAEWTPISSVTTSALEELAVETGGLTAAGSRNVVSLLPRIAEDLNAYYSLAYRTPVTGTTRSRGIAVHAKNRELTVRSRSEYVEKTDVTRMQDRVIANLYRPADGGSIALFVELGKIEKIGRARWSVPLRINLPVSALSVGEDGAGSFSVFLATGGVVGAISDVQQSTQRFSAADLTPGQEHVTFEVTLTFNGATSVVSVGVFDAGSKDFGLKTVDLPAYRARERIGGE
jgi:VWFA-related protein